LSRFGLAGTYYASFGLMGKEESSGRMFLLEDLATLRKQGHELGCHTFSHCDSWTTDPKAFEKAIVDNRSALSRLLPGAEFKSFSYPISLPRPLTKARVARHFLCCRGGGQTFNAGTADLNQLSAFFLEKTRSDIHAVKEVIDQNRHSRGWLIVATHDISDSPTLFGCSPAFFEAVVRYAIKSGASVVPVSKALEQLLPIHKFEAGIE
jgi:peptidoglycan/xylan/chitin deacetylase (PgdA/CDA1 family)